MAVLVLMKILDKSLCTKKYIFSNDFYASTSRSIVRLFHRLSNRSRANRQRVSHRLAGETRNGTVIETTKLLEETRGHTCVTDARTQPREHV